MLRWAGSRGPPGNESGAVSSFVAFMVVLSFANFAKLMRSYQEHERR